MHGQKKEPAMTVRITSSLLVFFAAGLILTPGETSARGGRGYRAPVARAAAVVRIPHANIRQRRFARNALWYGGYGGYGYYDGGYDYYDPGYGDDYNRQYQSAYVPSQQQQPAGPKVVYSNQPTAKATTSAVAARSGCAPKTYKVPAEGGGQRTIKIVNC
jgi:hypothetical protein